VLLLLLLLEEEEKAAAAEEEFFLLVMGVMTEIGVESLKPKEATTLLFDDKQKGC